MIEILVTTLKVSLSASIVAFLIAIPIVFSLSHMQEGLSKRLFLAFLTMANSLPPVFVGLALYLLFAYAGFFKSMNLLFTQSAMTIAQIILSTPVIVISAYSVITGYIASREKFFKVLHLSRYQKIRLVFRENFSTFQVAYLVGLGRCLSEVGAVMIVGGNISGDTRVLTSSIVLETSRGNLAHAIQLGGLLLGISILLSATILVFKKNE